MNNVEISFQNITQTNIGDGIRLFCLKVLQYLDVGNWEISILICDDDTIKDLNYRYRSKNEATDVLSFNQDLESRDDIVYAGDIVISLDTLNQHSKLYQVTIDQEIKRVLIHGILHLKGMDHQTNSGEEPMLQIQEEILKGITGEKIL